MKNLIFALLIVGITTIGEARECVQPFNCAGAEWGCEKNYDTFTTRQAFIDWLHQHPSVEFRVIYTTSTRTDIIWDENCYSRSVDCTDPQGDCDYVD